MNEREPCDYGMQQEQEEAEFIEQHKGWYSCVYCGKVYQERPLMGCCGEVHFDVIGE